MHAKRRGRRAMPNGRSIHGEVRRYRKIGRGMNLAVMLFLRHELVTEPANGSWSSTWLVIAGVLDGWEFVNSNYLMSVLLSMYVDLSPT